MSFVDSVKYCLLWLFVITVYIVSHIYDYVTYPIYFLYYHPWLVRRYKRSTHARQEVRDDCVIYHSLQEPTEVNTVQKKFGLDTMTKVFDYVTKTYPDRDCLGTREIIAEEDEVQPNGKIFKKFVLGKYEWISFNDFRERAAKCSRGLRKLGLRSKDKVAILAETRADWIISAYACFQNNLTIVTLYTNLGDDGVIHAINETKVEVLITSFDSMTKVKAVSKAIPSVKTIVCMESLSPGKTITSVGLPSSQRLVPFTELMTIGEDSTDPSCPPTPDDVAIIMYTSGSTGKPKGVMLTHRNLLAAMCSLLNIATFKPRDRYIAYLPLAHVLELLAESSCLMYGIKIGYSSSLTLTNKSSKVKAGSKGDANVLRPTLMCSVPLVLERIYKSVVDTMRRQGWAAEELFHYFMRYKMKWQDRGFDTPFLNKTLFRKIRYFLGGRVRLMLSGGAPLSEDTHSLTRTCICVPLMQGYGLTETTACATVTSTHDRTTGRAGAPLMNVQVKLVDWEEGNYRITDKPHPRGEIHVGGDNVALGYFDMPEKTAEDFYDEDGRRWFRTGDIGEFHADGVLKIIDRKKDLVKLQHGEYVSYGKVEAILKTCPIVENICLYADSSKDFLVAVIIPDRTHLSEMTDLSAADACKDEGVNKQIVKLVQEYGLKNGLLKGELPNRVALVTDEWTPDSGLVTAAFKIRRRFIVDKYQNVIKQMYA